MKKFMFFCLLLFGAMVLNGCSNKGELEGVANIKCDDIFNQEEDKYYVYFHRLNCEDCDSSAPYVIQYSKIMKDYQKCSSKRKIYAVLLYTSEEKPNLDKYIYRTYEGEGGQGTDNKFFVDGVTKWEDLYIGSTSSLISISKNPVTGIKEAKYVQQGSQSVVEALQKQLGNCY